MKEFEFTNYDVEIKISGHIFTLDCSSDTGDYLKKCSGELLELSEAMKRGEKTADDAVQYGMTMLDTLLGDGASDKIFADRKKRVSDILDIGLWLAQVASEFQRKRAKDRARQRSVLDGTDAGAWLEAEEV